LEPYQQLILGLHNQFRSIVASGNAGLPSATKLKEVQWNSELANLAELNTKKCVKKTDACCNTPQFLKVGQTVGIYTTTGTLDVEAAIRQMTKRWHTKDVAASDIKNFSKASSAKDISSFTVIVNDRQTEIGCGMTRSGDNTLYFACDYSTNNILNKPVYEIGPAASKCKKLSESYANLCA